MRARTDMILMSAAACLCWVVTDVAVLKANEVDLLFPEDSRIGMFVALCAPLFYIAVILSVRVARIAWRMRRLRLPH